MSDRVEADAAVQCGVEAGLEAWCGSDKSKRVPIDRALRIACETTAGLYAGRVPAEVWGLVAKWRGKTWALGATSVGNHCADELEAALKSVPRSTPDLRGLIAGLRESAHHHQHDYEGDEYHLGLGQGLLESAGHIENMLDHPELNAAKRPAEPAPRMTSERYDAAYQRAVDASVRGEATVKDALYRELGVVETAPRALPMGDGEIADVLTKAYAHHTGHEPGPAERTAFLGMARVVFDMVREYSAGAADELQKLRGQMAAPRALPSSERVEAVRAYCTEQRIVSLERRSGDGRDWDVSYDAQRELTDEQIAHLAGLLCPAPDRALLTRDDVCRGLFEAYWGELAYGCEFSPSPDAGIYREADYVLSLLREHASPADEASVPSPGKIVETSAPAVCPITGEKFFMVINHPGRGPTPTYGGPHDSYTLPEPDADGSFTRERYSHDQGGWVEGCECLDVRVVDGSEFCDAEELQKQLDEQEAKLANAERERDEARAREREAAALLSAMNDVADKLKAQLDERTKERNTATAQMGAAVAASRAASVALDEVCPASWSEQQDHEMDAASRIRRLGAKLAQLAARPEPVVIDEALLKRVEFALLRREQPESADVQVMANALRGVAGPTKRPYTPNPDGPWEFVAKGVHELACKQRDAATAERDKLRVALQAAQADISSLKYTHEAATKQLIGTQREYEALRAACEWGDFKLCDGWAPWEYTVKHIRKQDHHAPAEYIERVQAAILKPATPEVQDKADPERFWNAVDEAAKNVASWPAWKRGVVEEPATPEAPSEANERGLEKVRDLAEKCGPLPCSMLAVGTEPSASLAPRVERLEAALRCFLTAWDGSDPRSRPQAAAEALALLDAGKQEVSK